MSSYDVIVIGSGAGGGTLVAPPGSLGQADPAARARRLAARASRRTGSPQDVFVDNRYVSPDTWYDARRQGLPAAGALLRRRRDEALRRGALPAARGGLRRAAPPRRHLAGLADRLRRARALLHAGRAALPGARRARRGPDRAAGERARIPFPAVSHEPRIQQLSDDLAAAGTHPFHAPCGIMLERGEHAVQRLRALRDLRRLPVPRARQVRRRGAGGAAGARAPQRHAADQRRGGRAARPTPPGPRSPRSSSSATASARPTRADIVVVSCGAANSAKLLLASANDKHPERASPTAPTRSGATTCSTTARRCWRCPRRRTRPSSRRRSGSTTSTSASDDFEYPLGNIQMVGKSSAPMYRGEKPIETKLAPHVDAGATWPGTRSTSGSRPRTCRGPTTGSRSTATAASS